ncbi:MULTISPECIES: thioesterase family protein [unclassified Rhodococcus (in: high G+C Gram-positive bacteria)]|uniref:thioesterase family protein n=1 Tax=unclassified Rhodococcus (in: high G+C Gram-positive bacteria) TaxID=192944 RepID=UPI000E0C5500|nr:MULTISPECIES: thioesterase family protein [unclassified Rhodococcus (in: high G+C Gram-positive bacteria)]QKT11541.1 thioesterase family protein [Rhodococcus sp. W8901]RDI19963.1 thioesterase superfamily protein [Rhodococcus sp. AG1013]
MSDQAYYIPLGRTGDGAELFGSTPLTASTWADTMQHGAPPSALLVRALERCGDRPDTRLTRVVVEILGPIPITDIEVRSWIERPGKRVELVVAELWAAGPDGTSRAVARGTGWRMETVATTAVVHTADAPLRPVSEAHEVELGGPFWGTGFVKSLEWRWLAEIGCEGPGQMWARPIPVLVEGESLTPIQRLFTVADVSNGAGAKIDPAEWTFLNTDLTVHLFRVPEGEWIGLSSETSYGPDGVGMCAGVIHDETGAVGRINQTLQIRAR